MGLRDIGATLPPGFRFHPSDEELVCHYLYNKINTKNTDLDVLQSTDLVEIDLHICEPWQLPDVAKLNASEWYFFSFRDRKYATGFRTNRATISGYWKATGKDRTVVDPRTREVVGMRKTLVFYKNRAPNGIKTGWIMHEFRLETPYMPPKEDWVLCRVFHKAKSSSEDKTNTAKSLASVQDMAYEHHIQNDIAAPMINYPPHYTHLTPSSSPPLSDHHDPQFLRSITCAFDPIPSFSSSSSTPPNHSNYPDTSFLGLLYQNKDTVSRACELSSGDHGDDYGSFFFDMGLEKGNNDDGVASNLEDIHEIKQR